MRLAVLITQFVRQAGAFPEEHPDVPVTETFRVATVPDTFLQKQPL